MNLVSFVVGFLIGATLVTVILGLHCIKLINNLREDRAKLRLTVSRSTNRHL